MTSASKKHLGKAPALAASVSLIISPMMAIPAFAAETPSIAACHPGYRGCQPPD